MDISTVETPRTVTAPATDSSASAVQWPAILAGAVAAAAVTMALLPLGSTLGFASDTLWRLGTDDAVEFTTAAAIWMVVMQWLSSFVGGYLAGRLRTRWSGVATDEVFFRDTAHGLLSWCLATFAVALVAGGLLAGADDTAARVVATVAADAGGDAPQTGIAFSAALSISMFLGAFIASVAGVIGGRQRDT